MPDELRRMLRREAVLEITGHHPKTFERLVAQGLLPAPIKIGPRAVAWPEDEIVAWQVRKIAERDAAQNAKREERERAARERAEREARRVEYETNRAEPHRERRNT